MSRNKGNNQQVPDNTDNSKIPESDTNTVIDSETTESFIPEEVPTVDVPEDDKPSDEEPKQHEDAAPQEGKSADEGNQPSMGAVLTISTGSILSVSSSRTEQVDASLVKVKISYPEGYTGGRYMTEGEEYDVSSETAKILYDKGIATKVD